jgi:hypothetical protein
MKAIVLSLPLQQGFPATILERVSLKYFQKRKRKRRKKRTAPKGGGDDREQSSKFTLH